MTEITRRSLLAGTMLAAAATALPKSAAANAPAAGKQAASLYRYKIGDFEMTAIHDGIWNRPIDEKFVRNAPFAEVQKVLADAFLPTDKLPIPLTTLLVNTGSKLVLLDTGSGGQLTPTAGTMTANLAAAGLDPNNVDVIVISHFHPDHINGIKTKDNELVFANAEILVPAPEWAFWMDDARMSTAPEGLKGNFLNVRRIFGNIAKDVGRYEPGREVAPGITSIAAYGHTPGHMAHPETTACWCSAIPVSIRRCLPGTRNGKAFSTLTAAWRWTPARSCSTAPPPTGCWCRAIISPSRLPATSAGTARATISCR